VIFIGIDPGKTGAIVALNQDGKILLAEMCPVCGKDFNDSMMAVLVRNNIDWGDAIAGIEKPQTRPGESLRGALNFGEGVGIWRGIFAANGIGWRWIMPQAWQQRALSGEKRPKERKDLKAAVTRSAMRRWPELHEALALKKNQGIADAAWIAEHVRLSHTRVGGGPQ